MSPHCCRPRLRRPAGQLPNSPSIIRAAYILNEFGVKTEIFPLFIFVGIGALMDSGRCCRSPSLH
jgi:Na+-transporting methylmalonyl-CoA/oxaloacetate decarboxylase beta subunit